MGVNANLCHYYNNVLGQLWSFKCGLLGWMI